jgi:hypothetical protein
MTVQLFHTLQMLFVKKLDEVSTKIKNDGLYDHFCI